MFKRSVILCVAVATMFASVTSAQTRRSKSRSDEPPPDIKKWLGWKPIEEGDVGRIAYRVTQVVDDNNAIVEIRYYPWVALADLKKETVWLKTATKGMVDGTQRVYEPDQSFNVVGTKRYETANGASRTVWLLEPTDNPEVQKERAAEAIAAERRAALAAKLAERKAAAKEAVERRALEEKEAAGKEADAAKEAAKWRTWTDSMGKHKIEAKFGGMAVVTLIKRDGSTIQIPLEKLSREDQQWLETRLHK